MQLDPLIEHYECIVEKSEVFHAIRSLMYISKLDKDCLFTTGKTMFFDSQEPSKIRSTHQKYAIFDSNVLFLWYLAAKNNSPKIKVTFGGFRRK
jgi:hypothetical protein